MFKQHNPPSHHVLVIGAAGLDMIGRVSESPQPGISTPAEVRPSFGGVARNVAENLAHLGIKVSLITIVGSDLHGRALLEEVERDGVDTSACRISPDLTTASYLAVINSDGHLQFALDDTRILAELKSEHLRDHADLFKQAALVFVDANLSPEALSTVFQLAEQAGTPVCADATTRSLAPKLLPHLKQTYLLTANSSEAARLCQDRVEVTNHESALQAAKLLINQGARTVVIPLAEFGVCYATSQISGNIPAIHTTIVAPTGAGDALTASLIFGLLNEIELDEAVRLGVSAASLTLRSTGTVVPDLSVEKLYDQLVI